MDKIQFSDINKFLTSLGLIFIGVAIILPWFISQNLSLVILEQEKIEKLSSTAKKIICNQQNYFLFISQNLIIIIPSLVIIGLIFLIFGIVGWKKRQSVIDEIQDEELKSKKQQNISNAEKKEIIEDEIENENEDDSPIGNKSFTVQKYIGLENMIYLKISSYYQVNYITSQNIKIGRFNYDIIMKSKFIEKRGDLILEVKYFSNTTNYNIILESTNRFLLAIRHYENTQQRNVTPVIIFIFDEEADHNKMNEQKEKLRINMQDIERKLRIKFFKESELNLIKIPKLLSNESIS